MLSLVSQADDSLTRLGLLVIVISVVLVDVCVCFLVSDCIARAAHASTPLCGFVVGLFVFFFMCVSCYFLFCFVIMCLIFFSYLFVSYVFLLMLASYCVYVVVLFFVLFI